MDNNQRVNADEFVASFYEKISPHLNIKSDNERPVTTDETPQPNEEHGEQGSDYESTEGDEHDHHEESSDDHSQHSHDSAPSENKYDDETQRLIDEAQTAKRTLEEADSNIRNMESEIDSNKKKLDMDLGPNGEFASMIDKCFEYEDREYVYKLCPYDRTVQKSKSNHQETSIGNWKSWNDEDASKKYLVMKFDNGQACWNGPMRSTKVIVSCGIDNKLVSVSEPNRCEVRFKKKFS